MFSHTRPSRLRAASLALVLSGLAACAPPPPLTIPPEAIPQVAAEIAKKVQSDQGRVVGNGLQVRGGSAKGNTVIMQLTATEPRVTELAEINPKIFDNLMDAVVQSEFCKDASTRSVLEAGLVFTMQIYSPQNTKLSESRVDQCG